MKHKKNKKNVLMLELYLLLRKRKNLILGIIKNAQKMTKKKYFRNNK